MFRIARHSISNIMACLGLTDAMVVLALFQGLILSLEPELTPYAFLAAFPGALLLSVVTILLMAACGLYEPVSVDDTRSLAARGMIFAAIATFFGTIVFAYILLPEAQDMLRASSYGLYFPIAGICALVLVRIIFRRFARSGVLGSQVVIIGRENDLSQIERLRAKYPGAHFSVADKVQTNRLLSVVGGTNTEISQVALRSRLYKIARDANASTVLVMSQELHSLPIQEILQCKLAGMSVTDGADFLERSSGRVDLDDPNIEKIILAPGGGSTGSSDAIQRLLDLLLSTILFCFLLPVMLVAALVIKLQDGGDIFYLQDRVGRNGSLFRLIKFRSMCKDAEHPGKPVWAENNDARITPAGKIIRQLRIDELPQLLNVFKGDMSLVGPRPERPYFVNQLAYSVPHYLLRHSVKPGITGWAQVNFRYGASVEDARTKHAYDLYYIKHRGFLLYLLVILRTVRVVLWPSDVMAR